MDKDAQVPANDMTKAQVARYFGVSSSAVDEWRRKKWLPFYRLPSGAPRFRTEDVRAFRESHHTQEETA